MSHDVYIPFLVTGIFVFTFTQTSVMSGVRAISGNLGLVRALHFPRASCPSPSRCSSSSSCCSRCSCCSSW